jgi:PKD repeat protein
VTVASSPGNVTAGALTAAAGGRGGFNVHSDGTSVKGELQFRNGGVDLHAHELTAAGIARDGRSAWFAGTTTEGQPLLAYVEDNGEPGTNDVFQLWIGGVAQTGDGRLAGGNVQIHKDNGDDRAPLAVATASPASGAAPLTVSFDGSGSHDPDAGDTIAYAWDLNGDGLFDDATSARPTFTYSAPGTYGVRLELVDSHGAATIGDTLTISVGAPAPSLPSGLVAAYSFDGGQGATAADVSGNGNTGTLTNATWSSSGKYGGALAFDGSSSWVTVADSATLHLTGRMTLEAWVRPSALGGWRTVVMKQQTGADVDYSLYADTARGAPATQAYTAGGNTAYGAAAIPMNAWTHLAASWDGSTVRLYVNGSLVSSLAVSGTLLASAGPLRIGGNGVWGEFFAGLIDEVRVYDRALSQSEIQADMQTPIGG